MPSDTNNRQQRNSRVVPRHASEDNLWDAVRDGVIVSADLDERMMPMSKPRPSPRLLPYQQQESAWPAAIGPPPAAVPPQPPRPPLGDVTNATPGEVEILKKHLKLQEAVINGLCRLRVFEAEN